ncbi:MAG TPA: DUF6631 family protein [Cellvibrio sp.]|nr:DUF6631 family protein [Cellvibrio sp.]
MSDGAEDLDILIPKTLTIPVDGKDIVFREYGFYAGLKARSLGKSFIDDMAELFNRGEEISLSDTDALMGSHADAVVALIALATGQTQQWLMALGEIDGQKVYNAWWEINGPFFVRCAAQHLRSERIQKLVAGLMYGQHSSLTATMQTE